jgi:hypothetical protein
MIILIFLLLPFSSVAAGALLDNGGSSFGNGGHSVRCVAPGARDWSAPESLDLYEGRLDHNYEYPNLASEKEAETYAFALTRKLDLASSFDDISGMRFGRNYSLTAKLRFILKQRVFLDSELLATDDAKFSGLDPNCQLVQTINFGREILFNQALWSAHSPVEQSALLLHEAIYWQLRSQGRETDSRRVRRLVAYLISGRDLAKVIQPAVKALPTTQFCRSKSLDITKATELYATINSSGNLELYFRKLGNFRMLAETLVAGPAVPTPLPFDRIDFAFQGELQSVLDKNSHFSFAWDANRQELSIRGLLEKDYPIEEILECKSSKR